LRFIGAMREEFNYSVVSIETADTLKRFAEFSLKRKNPSDALAAIDECLMIYDECVKRWKTDSYKRELKRARKLKKRITKAH
jgi:hypothetical protein